MVRHSAFGITNALGIDDRAALEARIVYATRQGAELQRLVDRWASGTTFTTQASLLEPDAAGFNVYVEMSRPHPHDRWATIASSMAHASRHPRQS